MLNEVGIENVALHAMIPQAQRLAALNRFKSNRVKILIATDVASRGEIYVIYIITIQGIEEVKITLLCHVIHNTLPF